MGNMHEFPACIDAGGLLPRAPSKTGFTPPQRFVLIEQFKGIMLEALAHNASDVYIQPGLPICARINGDLMALTPSTLDESEVKYMIKWTSGRDTAETDILSGVPVNARYELFSPTKLDARGAKVRHGYRVNISPILYFGGTSGQRHRRLAARQVHDAHVLPEDAVCKAGAERFRTGFLGREALGVGFRPVLAALGFADLDFGKTALGEALGKAFDGAGDAADIDQVAADADDHRGSPDGTRSARRACRRSWKRRAAT